MVALTSTIRLFRTVAVHLEYSNKLKNQVIIAPQAGSPDSLTSHRSRW